MYLRVTVNCVGGQTQTANFTVYECNYITSPDIEEYVDNKKLPEIEVFPNPANSDFTILIKDVSTTPKDVYISNAFGVRKKIEYTYDDKSRTLYANYNASVLSNGLHVITYLENNNIISKKILIQHE